MAEDNTRVIRSQRPPERRYAICTEPRKPLFTGTESKVGRNHYLHIPREHLPPTKRGDILEARIARTSAIEKRFCLYTSSDFKDSHTYISSLNPTRHESFAVTSIGVYGVSNFVRDFNKHRPEDFANVMISESDGKVIMRVDKSEVEIIDPRLTADGSRAILHGILATDENRGSIRIAKRFETYQLVLADLHARIVQLKGFGSKIQICYMLTQREAFSHIHEIGAKEMEEATKFKTESQSNRFLRLDCSNMSRKEIRAWIDTEGHIDSPPLGEGGPQINVSQKHREPLETFLRGVGEFGVRCSIARDKRTGQFVARIVDVEGVARVISEVGPFRTPQKNEQVRRFVEYLNLPRRERRRAIERARRLMDV